jgi:2-methylcitrate dehydratase PrpD
VTDARLRALAARVRLIADGSLAENEAHMSVRLADGRVLSRHVKAARGTAANPLSRAEVEAKFRRLAAVVLADEEVERLLEALRGLPALGAVGGVAALAGRR